MHTLTCLLLRNNKLTVLPESIGGLQKLTHLDVDDNQLTALPESIGGLQTLTQLEVRGNPLTALPDSIGGLQALKALYFKSCQLTALPKPVRRLQQAHIAQPAAQPKSSYDFFAEATLSEMQRVMPGYAESLDPEYIRNAVREEWQKLSDADKAPYELLARKSPVPRDKPTPTRL